MFEAPRMDTWRGRVDSEETDPAPRWHQQVVPIADNQASGKALLGFACDAGVRRNHGRPGARRGPEVIRAALCNLAWHGDAKVYDAGTVVCEEDELEAAQSELGAHVAALLKQGHCPIVLGGGHEVAFGSYLGIARYLAEKSTVERLGIVNLDAHFDLRRAAKANSGTPFRQIAEHRRALGQDFHYCCFGVAEPANTQALFARAASLDVMWRFDDEMGLDRLPQILVDLAAFLAKVDVVHFTIDMDVLPSATAPGVSAPAARGVDLIVVEAITDAIKASGKMILAELAEFNPDFDIDGRTAKVAARLVYRLIR